MHWTGIAKPDPEPFLTACERAPQCPARSRPDGGLQLAGRLRLELRRLQLRRLLPDPARGSAGSNPWTARRGWRHGHSLGRPYSSRALARWQPRPARWR